MSNVVAIRGGPTGQPEPNPTCIATLEEWLERARSGEIVGVALAALHHDGVGSYAVGGRVGGYSMLGALEMACAELVKVNSDDA
ncbi:hypothetical protein [Xanthobacter sediminis]